MVDDIKSYKRLDGETPEELIYRVCSDKDSIGSWNDVAIILNTLLNQDYGESTYRKKFQSFNKMLDANRKKFSDSSKQLAELDKKIKECRQEQIKLQTLNIERNRLDRSESRQELYYQYVGNVINTLPLPEFEDIVSYEDNNSREYILNLSDLHYGASFVSENNIYSPEITRERLFYLTSYMIDFIKSHKLHKLHVLCTGDVLQGLIHLTDLKINDSTVVKSCVEICRLIAQMLNTLSAYVQIEYYHTPSANHTQIRALGAKANELMDEDMEYLIGNYIKDLCANNNRITVHLTEEGKQYVAFSINGYNIVAMHGHQIKNIESAIKDISMMRREFVDILILGHYHAGKQITVGEGCCADCEVLINPSFVGSDPYSDSLMKGGKAAVSIYGIHEIYGHDETHKVILN